MALAAGTRLGVYEIDSLIGAGGMGEVYKARDTQLQRDVALKILPSAPGAEAERRGRFEREAKAVAALNHPNIVTIHAVEEADGVPFFAMEYVDGKTLAQLIPARGLPLAELLRIAIPFTDAVAAAHQRGILHRDLKPANVMLTAEGRVKVLDFGLAKLKEAAAIGAQGTSQATMEVTGEERILGTVAYMSPEQAEGKPLDERSDVFALGIVLYEMATAQRPFKGDTSVSVISAILKDTPSSVTDVRPDLPRDLVRILKRALNKDPEHRYQSAKDLRNDLEALKEDLDSGQIARTEVSGRPAATSRRRLAGAVVVGLAILAGIAGWFAWRAVRTADNGTAKGALFDDFTVTALSTPEPAVLAAVSPDGRYVAYVSAQGDEQALHVRQVDALTTLQLVAPAVVSYGSLSFSPSANRLYYTVYPNPGMVGVATLYEVPVLGGAPRKVLQDVDRDISFSPDGTRFTFVRGFPGKSASIMIANADGSGERTLASRQNPDAFLLCDIAWSPDGRSIAGAASAGTGGVAIVLVDVATGSVRVLEGSRWGNVSSIRWPRGQSHLVVAGIDYPFGGDTAQIWDVAVPSGEARRITKATASYARLSLTADARLLMTVQAETHRTISIAPAAKPGDFTRVSSVPDSVIALPIQWTKDGRLLYTANPGGDWDVWAVRPDGSDLRQLTTSSGSDGSAVSTRDGRYIVFLSARSGQLGLWRMNADGGHETLLAKGFCYYPLTAGDSQAVYYTRRDQQLEPLYMVPIAGGEPTLLTGTVLTSTRPAWPGIPNHVRPRDLSPDGSLIAATYWDDTVTPNVERIAILPVGGGTVRMLPFVAGGIRFAPDGKALTFARTGRGVSNLWRLPLDGNAATPLTDYPPGDRITDHAWSPDGAMLAVVRGATQRHVVIMRDIGRR